MDPRFPLNPFKQQRYNAPRQKSFGVVSSKGGVDEKRKLIFPSGMTPLLPKNKTKQFLRRQVKGGSDEPGAKREI